MGFLGPIGILVDGLLLLRRLNYGVLFDAITVNSFWLFGYEVVQVTIQIKVLKRVSDIFI